MWRLAGLLCLLALAGAPPEAGGALGVGKVYVAPAGWLAPADTAALSENLGRVFIPGESQGQFQISVSWNAVAGASGYRIHAGKESGIYTHVSDNIPAPTTTGTIYLQVSGEWYVAVAAYDENGYEGLYSAEIIKAAT